MRARKAERCLQRASAAIENGSIDEATSALEEARQLDPSSTRVQELTARLEALSQPKPDLDLQLEAFSYSEPEAPKRGFIALAVAVVCALALLGIGGWEAWTHQAELMTRLPSHSAVDAKSGSSAPTAATSAPGPTESHASVGAVPEPAVETKVVQPEVVTEKPLPITDTVASAVPPASIATTGSGTGAAANAPASIEPPKPSQSTAPPGTLEGAAPPQRESESVQRDAVTASQREAAAPTLEYTPPAAPPPAPTPSAATTFIPAVTPPVIRAPKPSDSPKPVNTLADSDAAPAPSTSSPSTVSSAGRDQAAAIRGALSRYEAAYNRLDVEAVRTVWPSLDERALSRAFDSLTSQRVALENCTVDVNGTTARANCTGTASWTPKVGGGERSASRRWTFDLAQADGSWRIVHVQAR